MLVKLCGEKTPSLRIENTLRFSQKRSGLQVLRIQNRHSWGKNACARSIGVVKKEKGGKKANGKSGTDRTSLTN